MLPETQLAERIAFGSFELETSSGELFRNGRKVRLSGQPADLLVILVRRGGQLISREELRLALWPDETFVDFDHGLNNCIRRIRDALGDSADSSRFIETLPKKGYRFIAETRTIAPQEDVAASQLLTSAVQSPEIAVAPDNENLPGPLSGIVSKRFRSRIIPAAVMLFAVMLLLGWLFLRHRPQPVDFHSVALLPLTNLSGDSSQDYLTDGVTDELITELAQAANVPVISRTSSMLYKDKKKPMPVIARELGVDAVVEGTLSRAGDKLRMTVHLINGVTDKSLWSQSYDGNMSNVREIEIRVAGDVADHIRASGQQKVQADAPRPVAPEAFEEYLKGQSLWQVNDEAALHHFERAAAIQPDYAAAYGGIAKSLVVLEAGGKMRPADAWPLIASAAEKALSLDNQNSDAHQGLSNNALVRDWDWSTSEAESLRAIASHPNNSYVYRWYGIKLELRGDLANALKQARLGLRLDPANWNTMDFYAYLLERNGNLKEALEQYQIALELNPKANRILYAGALNKSGQPDRAAAELEQFYLDQGQPGIATKFKRQYPIVGYDKASAAAFRTIALHWLEQLRQRSEKGEYVSPGAYAGTYAVLKDREETLRYLDLAYREHSPFVLFLTNERYDFLRNDPRFDKLYRSIPFYTSDSLLHRLGRVH